MEFGPEGAGGSKTHCPGKVKNEKMIQKGSHNRHRTFQLGFGRRGDIETETRQAVAKNETISGGLKFGKFPTWIDAKYYLLNSLSEERPPK